MGHRPGRVERALYKWFTGGKLNASHNALDRHVDAGRGDKVAFTGKEEEERVVTSTPTCCATSSASPTCSSSAAWSPATWSGSSCR